MDLNYVVKDGDRISVVRKEIIGFGPLGCVKGSDNPKVLNFGKLAYILVWPKWTQVRVGLFERKDGYYHIMFVLGGWKIVYCMFFGKKLKG